MRPSKNFGLTDAERDRRCTGKRRYADEVSAIAAAMSHIERKAPEARLFTYRCPYCLGYHLTRNKQKNQEPITAMQGRNSQSGAMYG